MVIRLYFWTSDLFNVKTLFLTMRRTHYIYLVIIIVVLTFFVLPQDIMAQCPMCRMSAESNLKNGGDAGKGLNKGILYLLAMPYLLIGVLGFTWWKRNRRLG